MIGDPGKEQFRDMILEMRNQHVAAGIAPLILFRAEVTANDDLSDRGGTDDPTRDHYLQLLVNADKWRRRLTYNPGKLKLGDKIAKAIDAEATITDSENPFGGDDIQMGSGGLYILPWAFDGSDENIALRSKLDLAGSGGMLLLGLVDGAIVAWSRLNSRGRTRFITQCDSMRVYGHYQLILGMLLTFGGDKNRVDVAQMRPTDEPRGPENSPNRRTESAGSQPNPSP